MNLSPFSFFAGQRDEFSVINSVVVVVSGFLSSYFGGRLADRWSKSNSLKFLEQARALSDPVNAGVIASSSNDGASGGAVSPSAASASGAGSKPFVDLAPFAWLPATACFLAAPFMTAVFLIPNLYGAMACLFVAYVVGECWFAPTFAIIQNGDSTLSR